MSRARHMGCNDLAAAIRKVRKLQDTEIDMIKAAPFFLMIALAGCTGLKCGFDSKCVQEVERVRAERDRGCLKLPFIRICDPAPTPPAPKK